MFNEALFTRAKIWKQSVFMDQWIKNVIHTYVYIMKCYLDIKSDILPFSTTWVILWGLHQVKQIRQRKTYTIGVHLYEESKTKLIDTENRQLVARLGSGKEEMGEMGKVSQKVKTFSNKRNNSWRCNVQHNDH